MTSPEPPPAGDALPQDVAALAAAEGLGELRATVKPERADTGRVVAGVAMTVIGLVLFVLPGLYFAWYVSRLPNFNRKQASRRLHLFENGLIDVDAAGSATAFRWDSMTVLQEIVRPKAYGGATTLAYTYRVSKADGPEIKLTGFFENPAEWGTVIQREVTRARLPGAVAALERGEAVRFDDIAVSARGISLGQQGEVPWSEVETITVRNGFVQASRAGRPIRSTTPVRSIPNFFVFFSLCERFVAVR